MKIVNFILKEDDLKEGKEPLPRDERIVNGKEGKGSKEVVGYK